MNIGQRVEEFIRRYDLIPKGGDLTCLVSGGADSTCLFHVLRDLGYRVSALHVNHGLRGEESLATRAREPLKIIDICLRHFGVIGSAVFP